VAGSEFQCNQSTERVANDVRLLDLQVVKEKGDVLDESYAVGFWFLGTF
jgi:hypothetical protein